MLKDCEGVKFDMNSPSNMFARPNKRVGLAAGSGHWSAVRRISAHANEMTSSPLPFRARKLVVRGVGVGTTVGALTGPTLGRGGAGRRGWGAW